MSPHEHQRFAGMTAVVTGAGSGIGAEVSRLLVAEGATVVGCDINEDAVSRTQSELGARFTGAVCDVTQEADVESLIAQALDRTGRLDVAFNVAGGGRVGTVAEIASSDWDFTIDLVLRGAFLCTKYEARAMTSTGGAIVNVSSLNAHVPMYGGAAYSVGKAGVEMLTRNAALELARHGIRVNAVLPGLVRTPLTTPMLDVPEILTAYEERISMRRPATTTEIAGPCLYLASAGASYITGASLVVDGGWEITAYPDMSRFDAMEVRASE